MTEIILVGTPTMATSRWLYKHFRGRAFQRDFVQHFSEKYRTSKGTVIPRRNVCARLRHDELRGQIIRE